MNHYTTAWLCRHHFSAVLDIEAESFEFPWDEAEFVRPKQAAGGMHASVRYA